MLSGPSETSLWDSNINAFIWFSFVADMIIVTNLIPDDESSVDTRVIISVSNITFTSTDFNH